MSWNRPNQVGPQEMGWRTTAQNFNLNRDYVKAQAPETRASLDFFREWEPDVLVDLHTTNGSYHGYALTYSPSLNPAGDIGPAFTGAAYARDSMLPELRRRVRARRGYETFDYGNFESQDAPEKGWFTYDHRPRFGTNYMGLRGRVAVLSEAYSHDPFERRVRRPPMPIDLTRVHRWHVGRAGVFLNLGKLLIHRGEGFRIIREVYPIEKTTLNRSLRPPP